MKKDFIRIFNSDIGIRLSLLFAFSALFLCELQRFLLFTLFHPFFSPLPAAVAAGAFAKGLIFDCSICASFFGLPLLMLNTPFGGKRWIKGWSFLFIFILLVFSVLLAADLFYFPEVYRHIAEELIQVKTEIPYLVTYAFTKGLFALVAVMLFAACVFYMTDRLINAYFRGPGAAGISGVSLKSRKIYGSLKFIAVLAALAFLQRGGLVMKPVGVADVYKYARSNKEAVLVMNGVFSAVNVSRKKQNEVKNDFPFDEAVKTVKRYALSDGEHYVDNVKYPLMRISSRHIFDKGKEPNVFFVMFEGWRPESIDSLSGGHSGDTPNFDKIVNGGLVFTNAYATGLRSIYGFASIFASVPLLTGLPVFGYGLELNNCSPVFRMFRDKGYATSFTQTSHRHSYRLCALASGMGAEESYGWEDIPETLNYEAKPDFGWDYEGLQFAAGKIKDGGKGKFFAAAFTGTTHSPFRKLLPQFDVFPNDSWENGYRNSLRYSDWAVGRLIERAKKEGWFDDTVFIFMSDHNQHPASSSAYGVFHIPLVVYAPKYFKHEKRDYVVSQLDILPSLVELAGINAPFTSLGRSIFDASRPGDRAALISDGSGDIGLLTPEGVIRHDLIKITDSEKRSDAFDPKAAEKRLLAVHKAAYETLKGNRWFSD